MFSPLLLLIFLLTHLVRTSQIDDFSFNGLLNLTAGTSTAPSGFFTLTNDTSFKTSHAFYSLPLTFKNGTSNATHVSSFSTSFVFAIVVSHEAPSGLSGHGMAFVVSPKDKPTGLPFEYLGLFNATSNGDPATHLFAVELDTMQNPEFGDVDSNHVGIDVNGLASIKSATAGYYSDEDGGFEAVTLASGDPIQVWMEYDAGGKQLNVTLHPIDVPRPSRPLLALDLDLSPVFLDSMYVGFSSCIAASSPYVLGWSFNMNGEAQAIDVSNLSSLPSSTAEHSTKKSSRLVIIVLPVIGVTCLLFSILVIAAIVTRKKKKSGESLEDWELEYGQLRFFYEDLKVATRSFAEEELLGAGGSGEVYRGILPKSKTQIAVKRISHGSHRSMKEFVAEIVSLGRLRHRNLVQLLGYCRRKGELLLVYELMPNGSLDKFLFGQPKRTLDWSQRFGIIKGVASGLLYLHEDWEMVVVHRDIKASNVLLDENMNGRLGDFGLARLYGHGSVPHATHVAGTFGYLAPELGRTGKASARTDVFAFGVFMLEVACGRRPIGGSWLEPTLVDWVLECWRRDAILDAVDPRLVSDGVGLDQMELVLKLGMLCSHPYAVARPNMRQVIQYLDCDVPLPELLPDDLFISRSASDGGHFNHVALYLSSVQESVLSEGR
ncbi:hypothetical protein ACLOJK_012913 [Asimina triloba]